MDIRFLINALPSVVLFLYIATTNLITHSGSAALALFTIAGLVCMKRAPSNRVLVKSEKLVFITFALYSAVYLLSFILNGLHDDIKVFSTRYIDDEMRMLTIIPIFFFFRACRIPNNIIWNGILGGAILSGIHALIYFWTGIGDRVSGSYDAIAFGDLSLLLAALSVTSYDELKSSHRIYRFLIPAAFILGLAGSILSGSRGGWVAIPALFIILAFYLRKFIKIRYCFALTGFCCVLIMAAYLNPATNLANRVESAVSETTDFFKGEIRYGGATVRLLGLQASLNIFLENPIIGAGPGNYKPIVDQKISQGELHKMTAMHSEPASTLFSTIASCGILGVAVLMGIFLAPCCFALRLIYNHSVYRNIGYGLLLLSTAFFHYGLFEIIFRRSLFTSFYIVMVAALMAMAANVRKTQDFFDTYE